MSHTTGGWNRHYTWHFEEEINGNHHKSQYDLTPKQQEMLRDFRKRLMTLPSVKDNKRMQESVYMTDKHLINHLAWANYEIKDWPGFMAWMEVNHPNSLSLCSLACIYGI